MDLVEVTAKEYKSELDHVTQKHYSLMKINMMDQYYTSAIFESLCCIIYMKHKVELE